MDLCDGISLVIKKKHISFGNKYRSMGLWNGISLGIKKTHISFGNKFCQVEGIEHARSNELKQLHTSWSRPIDSELNPS